MKNFSDKFYIRPSLLFCFLCWHLFPVAVFSAAEKCPQKQILLQGGRFELGSRTSLFQDSRPVHEVRIKDFLIANFETSAADFVEFAKNNPELEFNVVEVGCGLARPKHQTREQRVADIAPMFAGALELSNVFLPKAFGGKYINSKLGLDSDDWRREERF